VARARWRQLDLRRGVLRLPDPSPASTPKYRFIGRAGDTDAPPQGGDGERDAPPSAAAIFSIDGVRPVGTKKLHEAVAATWNVIGHWQLNDLRRGFSTRGDMMVPPAVARRLMDMRRRMTTMHTTDTSRRMRAP